MTPATESYITATTVICRNKVIQNGREILNLPEEDLPGFLLAVYRNLEVQYPKFHKMDLLSKMGWLAAECLLDGSSLNQRVSPQRIGVVLSNANSSLDTDLKYFETTRVMASPALFVYTLPNIVTGEICIRHGFKGENAFFVQEEFDADFMQQYMSQLINNNILQAGICGWVDLLGQQYKTVLFLVEKEARGLAQPFNTANIIKNFTTENG